MQGRLSPKEPARLQSFPHATWKEEFARSRDLGFRTLEWLVDDTTPDGNPLWNAEGRRVIGRLSAMAGVAVSTACAHCFIDGSLGAPERRKRHHAVARFKEMLRCCSDIGVHTVVLPVMETASLGDSDRRCRTAESLDAALPLAEALGCGVALESDLAAAALRNFVTGIGNKALGVCYDLGNATALGFDAVADLVHLDALLLEIHIKDRFRGGPSVMLGQGDTLFAPVFVALARRGWTGPMVLETPVGQDWRAAATANFEFARHLLDTTAEELRNGL